MKKSHVTIWDLLVLGRGLTLVPFFNSNKFIVNQLIIVAYIFILFILRYLEAMGIIQSIQRKNL